MIDALVILLVIIIAYIWSSRGFLSAFMHMLCVIAAGAIAFAAWEPVALWVLDLQDGADGYALNLSWGVALGVPFVVALLALRVATDKLVPFNLDCEPAVNLVGGGLCGAVSGVLTTGIMLLSVSYTRLPTDLYGYQPVRYDNNGSLTVQSNLILPAEKWTSEFYKMVSNGVFRPLGGESLARLRPTVAYDGAMLRTNFEDGKSKHAIAPSGFEVIKRYTLSPSDPKQIFADSFDPKSQTFTYLNGETANAGSSQIEGFVISFKAGAKERAGSVIIGPGQLQLVVETNPADPTSTMAVQPLAVVTQAQNKPELVRWRWDSPSTFFQSVGGGADATMAFEFVVPKGSKPIGLYVKGVRTDVTQMAAASTFASSGERDSAVRSKALMGRGGSAAKVDSSGAVTMKVRAGDQAELFITTGTSLPFGIILQKDNIKDLTFNDAGEIDGGSLTKYLTEDLKKTGFVDRKLQVRSFAGTDDTKIVQVRVDGKNTKYGFVSDAAASIDRGAAPMLIDQAGVAYTPIGYVFRNNEETHIYFSPQSPVSSVNSLPSISKSRPDAEMFLIFRVNSGANITTFAVGEKAIARFDPGFKVP